MKRSKVYTKIFKELTELGFSASKVEIIGENLPVIMVGTRSLNILFVVGEEINASKFIENWKGQVCTIRNMKDALHVIKSVVSILEIYT
jgi:hypothetical protein